MEDLRDPRGRPDPPDLRESVERGVKLETVVLRDPLDPLELLEHKDSRERQGVPGDLVPREIRAGLACPDLWDLLGLLALLVT